MENLFIIVHRYVISFVCIMNTCEIRSSLILINGGRAASIIHSREGVTQGYLLAMVAYGVGILPLIKNIKLMYH